MHFADILSVSFIGVVALLFVVYQIIKMQKNKAVSICNGCSKGGCSTRSFVDKKTIKICKPASIS